MSRIVDEILAANRA
jgi:carbonic anhydrase